MELAEVPELPAGGEVMDWNKTVTLEGTIDMESLGAVVVSIKQAWEAIGETFREAAEAFAKLWRSDRGSLRGGLAVEEGHRLGGTEPPGPGGPVPPHQKRRIRKKYRKRIVEAYLKEVSSTVSEYTCGSRNTPCIRTATTAPWRPGRSRTARTATTE